MICFNQDMSGPRRSGVQPAATSEESKILITQFSSSAVLNNQNETMCGPVHLYKKQESAFLKIINLGIFVA